MGDTLLEAGGLKVVDVRVERSPDVVGHRRALAPPVVAGRLLGRSMDRTVEERDRSLAGGVRVGRGVRVVAQLEVRKQHRHEADGDDRGGDEYELSPLYTYQTHIVTSPCGVGTVA